jgi:hypothetical protein
MEEGGTNVAGSDPYPRFRSATVTERAVDQDNRYLSGSVYAVHQDLFNVVAGSVPYPRFRTATVTERAL